MVKTLMSSLCLIGASTCTTAVQIVVYEGKHDLIKYLKENNTGVSFSQVVDNISSPDVKLIFINSFVPQDIVDANGDRVPAEVAHEKAIREGMPHLLQIYKDAFPRNHLDGMIFPTSPVVALKQQYDSAVKDGVENLREIYKKAFQSENIDALIFPTSPVVAPLANADVNSPDMFLTLIRNTEPGSVAGLPGLSFSAGRGKMTGLPVGLEIDGLPGTDEKILAIGKVLEEILQS